MASILDAGAINSTDAYLDWDYRVVSSAIWIPLSVIGVSGNLMVILVVMTVRGMKTPTNCYLVSLASADCLFCLSTIPSELSSLHLPDNVFVFGRVGCSILRFLPFLSINASSLSITAFTVERYIGICYPMKARYICTVKRAQIIIVAIWISSILYNSTWLFLTDLKPLNYLDWPDAYQCTFSLNRESYKAIFLIDMFMFYWIPLLLYLILYGVMARTLVKAGVFALQLAPEDRLSTMSIGKRASIREQAAEGVSKFKRIRFSTVDANYALRIQKQQERCAEDPVVKTCLPICGNDIDAFRASANFNGRHQLLPNDNTLLNGRRRSTPEAHICNFTKLHNVNSTLLTGTDAKVETDLASGSYRNLCDSSCSATRASPRGSKASCGDPLNRCRAQVVKMLIVIVVTFALFCLPYRGLVVYNSFTSNPWVEKWYLLFAKTMVMANSAVNPLLYNLMSGRFRDAFVVMFTQCFKMRNGRGFPLRHEGFTSAARSSIRGELRPVTPRQGSLHRRFTERHSRKQSGAVGILTPRRKRGVPFCPYNAEVKRHGEILIPIIALSTDIAFNSDREQNETIET